MCKKVFFKLFLCSSENLCPEGEEVNAVIGSARLDVCSHKTGLFVIALEYEGEKNYRYPAASDLTWRTEDCEGIHSEMAHRGFHSGPEVV